MTVTTVNSCATTEDLAPNTHRTPRPGVVERLTQILDVFAYGPERLMLDDVATATGLPRSTAFRLLSQMVDLDWLQHDSTGYRLGPRTLRLGIAGNDHAALRNAAADVLNTLQLRTGGVAHLAVLDGVHAHYLDKVGGTALRTIPSFVGTRLPADATECGQAMLATMSPEMIDQMFGRDAEPGKLSRLHQKLGRVRSRHGLAASPADGCHMSIGTVAAPVLGPSGPVAAISVAVRNGPGVDQIAPLVAMAARGTSRALFPNWTPPAGQRTTARLPVG